MAVTDPTYENFNYQGLLDRAASPLQTLGQGQLAIAQQENARRFEALQEQRRSESQQRNRLAEISATEAAGEKGEAARLALSQKAQRKQAVAVAQQIDPNFKDNAGDSDETATARANAVQHQQTLKAFRDTVDDRDKALEEYNGLIDKLGLPKSIDQTRLNSSVAQDPIFVNRLTPEQKNALLSGKVSVDDLIDSLRTGKVLGGLEGVLTGINPRDLANDLATKAQSVRQNLQQEQQQIISAKLGAQGQQLQSRFNTSNETASKLLGALPPYMLGDAMKYSTQKGGPLPGGASQTNPDGTLKVLNPVGYQPPAAPTPQLPPTAGSAADPVLQHVDFKSAVNLFQGADARAKGAQANVDNLASQIMGGDNLPVDQREQLAKDYQKAKTELAKATTDRAAALKHGNSVYHLNTTNAVPNFNFSIGNYPGGSNYGGPTNFPPPAGASLPNFGNGYGNQIQVSPAANAQPFNFNQPNQAPQQGAPASAQQQDPMQLRSIQNKISQAFGTSDPSILQTVKQKAESMGINVNALIQGVVQNDPHAIATAQGLGQQIQGGGQNPVSAGQLPPDNLPSGL